MPVVSGAVFKFVNVKIFEVIFTFKAALSRPAFSDLLKQHVPFGLMPVATGRFGSVVTERIIGKGPALQMPLPRLSVRPAHFRSIPFNQSADGRVAVHRLEHVETGA